MDSYRRKNEEEEEKTSLFIYLENFKLKKNKNIRFRLFMKTVIYL